MTPDLISRLSRNFKAALFLALSCQIAVLSNGQASALAQEDTSDKLAQAGLSTAPTGDFSFDDDKSHETERKEVEAFLNNLETMWNRHDIDGVMGNYADDYVNNDGIDKNTVRKLTSEFWKTYPDAHSSSATKNIRIDGLYATVDSRDQATGTTANEFQSIKSKGELQSLSEGRLYLKNISGHWKIIGDRIDFEKVKVSFGLAKQLKASFTAPEQIRSGKQFTARLDVSLPPGLNAVGSIANQPLKYPQVAASDNPRVFEAGSSLERVMNANIENCNELLTARVLLTSPARDKVLGVSVFTRRLNVVPEPRPESVIGEAAIKAEPVKADSVKADPAKAENENK